MRLSGAVLPWIAVATVLCIGAGLYLGFHRRRPITSRARRS